MRITIFIFFILLSINLIGQDRDKDYVTIETLDKKLISGKLIRLDKDSIVIRNRASERLSFGRDGIQQFINGIVTNVDRVNLTEPFYFPTALSNGKGNHQYKNYYIFGHNFNFGITEALDLSLGFELASIIIDNGATPVFQVGAKYSLPISKKFHMGLSGKYMFNDEGGLIQLQAPITFGGRSNNFTFIPSLALSPDFEDSAFFIGGNWSFVVVRKTRIIVDFLLGDGFRSSNLALEFSIKNSFTLIPGVIWSDEFSLIPSMAMTFPFGNWQ